MRPSHNHHGLVIPLPYVKRNYRFQYRAKTPQISRAPTPYGRLTFFACAKKVSKETHPCIRPRLRRGSLAPSPLQGHAVKGHPWPITALATSMSLNPFHGDSTRPPEGDLGVVCEIALQEQKPNAADFDLAEMSQARDLVPFRRPSGGVAQGDEPHGCGERLKGPWMALVSRPPEQHRSEGSFA